ncbi:MAG: hypothetical protein RLZZ142_2106 [Verrucomicrobiota bacterium]
MRQTPSRLHTWLQLLRAPNLFTVPGDPIAGYLVANSGFVDASLALVPAASLCFYAAGLLLNDLADLREDALERPNRPLPAGLASPASVRAALLALNALGLLLLFATGSSRCLMAGIATIAAVASYNLLTKKIPVLGALNMGLCRSLSILVGAFAGPSPSAYPISAVFALVAGLFIAAVTHLARFETKPLVPRSARILPLISLVPGVLFGAQNALFSPEKVPAFGLFLLPLVAASRLAFQLFQPNPFLPPLIGAHIRLRLPLQAALCWVGASQGTGPLFAAGLLLLWPVSRMVSKRFYAS